MDPPQLLQNTPLAGRIDLAIHCHHAYPEKSLRSLAAAYTIPYSTLRRRVKGAPIRGVTPHVNRKLTATEEQSIVEWILDLDCRGFSPGLTHIKQMADVLLAARTT